MNLPDEVKQHVLGDLEVRNHAVLERADGDDRAGGASQHLLGFRTDRQNSPRIAGIILHRHDRGFVAHDPLPLHVNQGISGAQIDRQIVGKPTKN